MALPAKEKIVGFGIFEVDPLRDPSGRTGQIAARLIMDFLSAIIH